MSEFNFDNLSRQAREWFDDNRDGVQYHINQHQNVVYHDFQQDHDEDQYEDYEDDLESEFDYEEYKKLSTREWFDKNRFEIAKLINANVLPIEEDQKTAADEEDFEKSDHVDETQEVESLELEVETDENKQPAEVCAKKWYEENKDEILSKIQSDLKPEQPSPTLEESNTPPPPPSLSQNMEEDSKHLNLAQILIFLAVFVAASTLLITASVEVYGDHWQGWAKAVLIEVSIIGLVVTKFKSMIHTILSKITLVALILASLYVLHASVETKRNAFIGSIPDNDPILTSLVSERDNYQKIHDALPEDHLTKRSENLAKISALNVKITKQRNSLGVTKSADSIHLKSNSELITRILLLLINILFGHKLVELLSTFNWSGLRKRILA